MTAYADIDDIAFGDADAYGAKAANPAELRDLTLEDIEVPDGYALPFYFYDEFMKHNGLYATVDGLLTDAAFQGSIGERDARLTRLRRSIRDGDFPDVLRDKIGDLQDEFPDTTSTRCRSSTNNEDLPDFNESTSRRFTRRWGRSTHASRRSTTWPTGRISRSRSSSR